MPGNRTLVAMAERCKKQRYGVHPGVQMGQRIVENMAEKTGRSLQQWAAVVKKVGLQDDKERVAWLKQEPKSTTPCAAGSQRLISLMAKVITGDDGVARCWWSGDDPLYTAYHDTEWGFPVDDDTRLFEKICLEGFQAGLAWITVLRKREAFRQAFAGFDFHKVARFTREDVERLLHNDKIIRHRGKIEATINNAQQALAVVDQLGSLASFFWQFEPPTQPAFDGCRSVTPESKSLGKELKRRGWSFVGPTTCYAFMQAMGLVNDHLPGCVAGDEVERARTKFARPA